MVSLENHHKQGHTHHDRRPWASDTDWVLRIGLVKQEEGYIQATYER